MNKTKCKICPAEIFWVQTETGKKMPLDVTPRPDGNVVLVPGEKNGLRWQFARVVTAANAAAEAGRAKFMSHWATCTSPNQFRRR